MSSRPLVGEPLALDLVNTWWVDRDVPQDFLDRPGGVAEWLAEHGLPGPPELVEGPLREARAALRAVLEHPGADSEARVNAVLARGTVRHALRAGAPAQDPVADPAWLPAWRCAADYLDLLRTRPARLRRCARPACVLHFADTSRNGTRRWCSMTTCGARTKSAHYYHRTHAGP